ncbi:CBS domain-containing protein [Rhodococcus oryzae]|uniref:CBS domain-containing protein n=2 Tax=Rhodococcus oryzae TaxID=2571143 RepID=A0ABY2RK88_9NOCA|nr:CBS domain-containing protein [Rhodococcus oryzae]
MTAGDRRLLAATGLRSAGTAAGRWVKHASYLKKWLVLGTAIGIIAGLGAVVFSLALSEATHLLLGVLGGYTPPEAAGDGGGAGSGDSTRPWAIPIVVCLGGLASGIIVFTFAPEAQGHGTDAAIEAIHRNPRMIRMRAVLVKLVASAIMIGSGGSGGREGPTAQISAGFGSLLARTLDLSPKDGRVAVAVGIGSGIGAIFGAPLGGALLAGSIAYRDDFEFDAVIPGLITSIVGYTVYGSLLGFAPLFGYAASGYRFDDPLQLVWFAAIGVLGGLVGLLYSRTFYGTVAISGRVRCSRILKPAIGGLLVGLMALALPEVLGSGYGWVQQSLDRTGLLAIPLWVVLVLPFAKILATSLSIGTGGSGGIFGPGMVIGAFTGAAVWRLLEPIAPAVPDSPAPFVIVGMMACFGSIARAPIAVMLMVAEMTGSLTILTPAMVAVGLAYLIVRHSGETIYRAQLGTREDARAARLMAGMPLLGRVGVGEAMSPPRLVLDGGTDVADALARLREAGVPGAPVVDGEGRFIGAVSPSELAAAAPDATLARRADAGAPTVDVTATLDEALEALPDEARWLTVLDGHRRVCGIVGVPDVVHGYRIEVLAEQRRVERVGTHVEVLDVRAAEDSPVLGKRLADRALPAGSLVVSVRRGDAVLPGTAATRLRAGDLVTVLVPPEQSESVRLLVEGESAGGDR